MELALQIAALLNTLTPAAVEILLMIRKQDGTVSIVVLLDSADSQFDANIKQAKDWLEAHPKAA